MPAAFPQEADRQLQLILTSRFFRASQRISRFLRFAVDESLAGRADALKETTIAISVFDRGPDHDPKIDPIVRVEARRLRAKLAAYYLHCADPGELVISMPPGSYRPLFHAGRPVLPPVPRVFVQPFAILTASRDDNFLAEGLTREIIHELTTVSGLRVTAASQGDGLWVVEGSVQRSNGRVRVFVNLLRQPARDYLWSERFEDQAPETFRFQEHVAGAVRHQIQILAG